MRPQKAIGKLPSSEKVRLYYATSVNFIPGHVEASLLYLLMNRVRLGFDLSGRI